jgi:DNA-binding IscR family transcriptional regulator
VTAQFPVAVHALVFLLHKGELTSSEKLAANICTNPARVRKVMAMLCRAGLAGCRQGKSSGYFPRPDGECITLRAVMEALSERPLSMSWSSGDEKQACPICSGMGREMDRLYDELNEDCLRSLEKVTIGSISADLFQEGKV